VTHRPTVAISMGDPSGIGPEVICKALARRSVRRLLLPILVGDLKVFEETSRAIGAPLRFTPWVPTDPLPRSGLPC
jgi:4-hydroxythreonine-4-phosphate dehydrogenase